MAIISKHDVPLNCTYAQRNDVKSLGAEWDAAKKIWIVRAGQDIEKFSDWIDARVFDGLKQNSNGNTAQADQELERLTQYWQYALEFSDLNKLTEDGIYRPLTQENILSANVGDDEIFLSRIVEQFKEDQQKSFSWLKDAKDIPVLILVGSFKKADQHNKNDAVFFVAPCLINIVSKTLMPSNDGMSRFNRQYLEPPISNNGTSFTLGDVKDEEDYFDDVTELENPTWEEWWQNAEELFFQVTGRSIFDFHDRSKLPLRFRLVYPKSNDGKTANIKALIKYLLTNQRYEQAALFKTIAMGKSAEKAFVFSMLQEKLFLHTGHMDQCSDDTTRMVYPLDLSQRTAVGHFLLITDGELLAVDGPPGTGKTSMMRDVIASEWVNATIASQNPICPIIIASAATNQAVTNIISSFDKVANKSGVCTIASRWLSDLVSYGWFLPSSSEEKKEKWFGYQLLCNSRAGWEIKNQGRGIQDKKKADLEAEFVRAFNIVFPVLALKKLQSIADFLHKHLGEVAHDIQLQVSQKFGNILEILKQDPCCSLKQAEKEYENFTQQKIFLEESINKKLSITQHHREESFSKLQEAQKYIFQLVKLNKPNFLKKAINFFVKSSYERQLRRVITSLDLSHLVVDPQQYDARGLLNVLSRKRIEIEDELYRLDDTLE